MTDRRRRRRAGNDVRDDGAVKLADALQTSTTLTSLYLQRNNIGPDGMGRLAGALCGNTSLKHLNLGWNAMGDGGVRPLARALAENSNLETLNVAGNRIGPYGAERLAGSILLNNSLTSLNVRNRFQPEILLLGRQSGRFLGLEGPEFCRHFCFELFRGLTCRSGFIGRFCALIRCDIGDAVGDALGEDLLEGLVFRFLKVQRLICPNHFHKILTFGQPTYRLECDIRQHHRVHGQRQHNCPQTPGLLHQSNTTVVSRFQASAVMLNSPSK